ncbi:hypothetical protein NDA16_003316 [Ustilago loliicola]|nr:hypothetical protein NDA16_003316 [Ustilago loliicola]
MADQQAGQEPDEFGALPGAVSNLRSRFEQLSKSESSRPSYKQAGSSANVRQKDLRATHTFGQAEKKLVIGNNAAASQSQKPKNKNTAPSASPPNIAADDASTPSSAATPSSGSATHKSSHTGPSTLSIANLAALSTSGSANSSTADLSTSNGKGTRHAEGPAPKAKLAPPRPPKPTPASHGVQILDDADLERLSSMGSSSRVSSLASMFGHHSSHHKTNGTEKNASLAPSRISTGGSGHFLKYSRSNEQLSPSADIGSEPSLFKQCFTSYSSKAIDVIITTSVAVSGTRFDNGRGSAAKKAQRIQEHWLATLLPPPIRNASVASNSSIGRSLGSSVFSAKSPGSDSSDDEDDTEGASSLSPSSSYKTPMGLRRPHAAVDMTPGGLPDTSHANRRAPRFNPDCCTSSKQAFQCFSVCGHTVVTGSGDKVKVYRVGESASGVGEKLCTVGEHLSKEVKLTALEFRPPNHGIAPSSATTGRRAHGETADEGRYLWCGTKDGHIWELDIAEAQVVYSRQNVHSDPIQLLKRVGNKMLSLDEGGKISIWLPSSDPDPAIAGLRLSNQPVTQRIAMEKGSHACIVGQQLWVASGPSTQRNAKDYVGSKGPRIRIYNPFADDKPFNALSKAITIPPDMAEGVGIVTGGAIIPSRPNFVYFGHNSGHVSIWSRKTYECVGVRKLGPHGLTAVAGVVKYLWVATRAGTISVFDTETAPWRALKIWTAHKEPITAIKVDEHGIGRVGRLQVASGGLDAAVHLWDGTLSFDWIEAEKGKREPEFCTYRSIKILHVTYNMDAASPSDLETSAENMEVFSSIEQEAYGEVAFVGWRKEEGE